MADQCIICLEDLAAVPVPDPDSDPALPLPHDLRDAGELAAQTADLSTPHPSTSPNDLAVAFLKSCGHFLHDCCLKQWSQQANSCPICRGAFNLIEVRDKVGGVVLSEYEVEDKKQVAEFDVRAWLSENEEDEEETEETRPCPICRSADQEEVLLLCDSCDAPYHTHCIGLDRVPNGHWFCMECANRGAYQSVASQPLTSAVFASRDAPRTRASIRRTREQERDDRWFGAWALLNSRIDDGPGPDDDTSDPEIEAFYLDSFTYAEHERTEINQNYYAYQRWQARQRQQYNQRLSIAGRQGARDVFRLAAPARLQTPQPPAESIEETRAWGAFEKAKEVSTAAPNRRKRKSRSATASPGEGPSAPAQPERKLKRPRTRRTIARPEPSVSRSIASSSRQPNGHRQSPPTAGTLNDTDGQPSFLSSLLKEVETNHTSDDERSTLPLTTVSAPNRVTSPTLDRSPAASPASSSPYHTPRALSTSPPPYLSSRSRSPISLTTRVEPMYPRANYLPNRSRPGNKSEDRVEQRQPRPRHRPVRLPQSEDSSPTRAAMSSQAKQGINKIVKHALAPHWKAAELSKEQYANINRNISRKLYEIAAEQSVHDESRNKLGRIAKREVANALKLLTA
ncbi:uncharacterized protein L3040_006772 [Drepanopeziza brunnea f. sp. 'multigermtubi']|uniref:Phd and ring finger domain protein n=1 Tax=Marssonina brunnea f. sp. multigermtubi (strain MB_m1) TaxID=1072389 RepID=K1XC54_MARBU|nr:phd and ring finger domain protein [Drepanopeziza brunnea f. sp. 'multigermtubi' MB_m1]EKD18353.1 phd and ring finger domain protein [Drepanopeziza brunnea f. sp. 'multigermtubi' MB_m1]KAJ5039102.1 hypothetical protein L3040_006772 [Drepanopeziza brunnea f. sp. 'multigermtubi']